VQAQVLLNRYILLLEDEALVALELQLALEDAGAKVLLAMSIPEALQQAEYDNLGGAVLDIRIGGSKALGVAARLAQRRLPFLFHTAHHWNCISQLWPRSPILRKPVSPDRIVAELAKLFKSNLISGV
jgi:CheY-like chemotaxis protein